MGLTDHLERGQGEHKCPWFQPDSPGLPLQYLFSRHEKSQREPAPRGLIFR